MRSHLLQSYSESCHHDDALEEHSPFGHFPLPERATPWRLLAKAFCSCAGPSAPTATVESVVLQPNERRFERTSMRQRDQCAPRPWSMTLSSNGDVVEKSFNFMPRGPLHSRSSMACGNEIFTSRFCFTSLHILGHEVKTEDVRRKQGLRGLARNAPEVLRCQPQWLWRCAITSSTTRTFTSIILTAKAGLQLGDGVLLAKRAFEVISFACAVQRALFGHT